MINQKPTSVILVAQRGDKVLATSRKTNHRDFGLPGGKVESGELPEDALRREIFEETGMHIVSMHKVFEGDNSGWPVIVYEGQVQGAPYTTENLVIKWASWDEVCSGSFATFNKRLRSLLNR